MVIGFKSPICWELQDTVPFAVRTTVCHTVCSTTAPTAVQRWMVIGMARLIDADALLDYFRNEHHESEVIEAVKDAPTIDAVPVVRCKDCKHYKSTLFCNFHKHRVEKIGTCTRYSFGWGPSMAKPGDFCSYGERKDNDG